MRGKKLAEVAHDRGDVGADQPTITELAWEHYYENAADWGEKHRELMEQAIRLHIATGLIGAETAPAVTTETVARWIRSLRREGYAEDSIANWLKALRGALRIAGARGLIAANPCAFLTDQQRPQPAARERTLSSDEMQRLLAACTARWRLSVLVLMLTGLRISELLGLRWQDIDWLKGRVVVPAQAVGGQRRKRPKTRAGRRAVPIRDGALAALAAHRLATPFSGDADFVFASSNGTQTSRRTFERAFQRAVARAGLVCVDDDDEAVVPHTLRHTWATAAYGDPTLDLRYLMQVVGHSSLAAAQRYVHERLDAIHGPNLVAHIDAEFGVGLETTWKRATEATGPNQRHD